MKIYFLLLVISILYEINCRCTANVEEIEFPFPDECFSREVDQEEVDEDGVCCYVQPSTSETQRECIGLPRSEISNFGNELAGEIYAFGCALD